MDSRTGESLSHAQTTRAAEFSINPMSVGQTAPFHLRLLYVHTNNLNTKKINKLQLQVNHRNRREIGFQKIFLQFRIVTTQLTGAIHSWTGILQRLKWRICNELASLGFFSLINLVYVIRHLPESVRWIEEVDTIDCKDDVKALLY
ncbi:AC3 [Sweet potato leaf curl Georgia virus-[China: Hebei: 2011]]|uniref:Replication enhancer n=1 Tax=Sweet potato leaf curl Georgia virus TaxID=225752 RepID=W8R2E8_9GEMI|nr:AC3 [Sweet potato leaf curl Georgia virus-[China: Hebei: 2011]]AHL43716.1 AC3 [Sweet potato leaf curl Georgia virus]ANT48124.1 AC3 [Sweet potato leaf curl Georgia virus]ANT48190.1 AC3 [Sweet potato leaf curl Georgia virus]ANT48202.1 AC3 [Sweet potato leaf curl Georgia virus]